MSRFPHCDIHKKMLAYNSTFDCYFCRKCNEWKEPKCSDPECWFCPYRPDKPFPGIAFDLALENVLSKRERMLKNLADR